MVKNILVIGGHGMLGKPVVRQLVKAGFKVRALGRDVDKVKGMLREEVEVVPGDLQDVDSIREAAEGMEAVYLNLNTTNPKVAFRQELDGVMNVLDSLKNRKEVIIAKIGGLTSAAGSHGKWLSAEQRAQAEQAMIDSGHPYLIFRPSWFFETLPMMVRKGKYMQLGNPRPVYWLAADDYGKMVVKAFQDGFENKIWAVQGPVPIGFEEIASKFIELYDKSIKIGKVPMFMVKIMSMVNPGMDNIYYLIRHMEQHPEQLAGAQAWEELGKPEVTLEQWCERYKK